MAGSKKKLTRKQIAQAKRLLKKGLTQRDVAWNMDCSQATISFAVNRQGAYA